MIMNTILASTLNDDFTVNDGKITVKVYETLTNIQEKLHRLGIESRSLEGKEWY
jgi:hypothetical protein